MVIIVDVKPNEAMRPILGKSIESEAQLVKGPFLGPVRSKRKWDSISESSSVWHKCSMSA
jgi:hypothetical protein